MVQSTNLAPIETIVTSLVQRLEALQDLPTQVQQTFNSKTSSKMFALIQNIDFFLLGYSASQQGQQDEAEEILSEVDSNKSKARTDEVQSTQKFISNSDVFSTFELKEGQKIEQKQNQTVYQAPTTDFNKIQPKRLTQSRRTYGKMICDETGYDSEGFIEIDRWGNYGNPSQIERGISSSIRMMNKLADFTLECKNQFDVLRNDIEDVELLAKLV